MEQSIYLSDLKGHTITDIEFALYGYLQVARICTDKGIVEIVPRSRSGEWSSLPTGKSLHNRITWSTFTVARATHLDEGRDFGYVITPHFQVTFRPTDGTDIVIRWSTWQTRTFDVFFTPHS
tara:strand:- start:12701 stop:13066 length:366 start_codon:yes stop_codon:yes gene_type:complete